MVPTPSFCPVRRWVLRALGRQKLAPHAYHQPPPPRCGPLCPAVSHAPPQVSPRPAPAPKAAQYCRSWQKATVNRRGKLLHRFVYNQQVLWQLLFLSPHSSRG